MTITVVTVCYNSAEALRSCYTTARNADVDVVLVDNASDDGLEREARRLDALLVRSGGNIGFGRGCNLGVQKAPSRHDWVAFVNPDLTITAESLTELVAAAPADAVAVAPAMRDDTGTQLGDVARVSPRWYELSLAWLLGRHAPTRRVTPSPGQRHQPVEVTSGACLVVRHDAFDAVGGFPDWLFLNSEDVYLCDRLNALGTIYVDHGITAGHRKLSSSRGVSYDQILAEVARAESAYAADRFPRAAWLLVYASIMIGMTVRAVTRPGVRPLLLPLATRLPREAAAVRRGTPEVAGAAFVGSPDARPSRR
jgi:N-acetylglucosaminyl-diphospho-decaprenol L-rhamnosyltransferase